MPESPGSEGVAVRRVLNRIWRLIASRAAQGYVAGPALEDALALCRTLHERGFATTLGFWNAPGDDPTRVGERYLAALQAVAGRRWDLILGVKAWALGFDPGWLDRLADRAAGDQIGLHFDSKRPPDQEHTFELLTSLRRPGLLLGCTLPGRWLRSLADAERAIDLGLRVRVVKGQWAELDPARSRSAPGTATRRRLGSADLRAGFLAVIDRLAGRARLVAVATHDAELLREAIRRLRAAGTPSETELLYGLPMARALDAVQGSGSGTRTLVPYGMSSLPYGPRQALTAPRVLWWLGRDVTLGRLRVRAIGGMPRGRRPGASAP